jgi:hypothetical protein
MFLKFCVIIDLNRSFSLECGTTALRSCEIRMYLSVWCWQGTFGTRKAVPCVDIGRNPLYPVLFFAYFFVYVFLHFFLSVSREILHAARLVEFRRRFRYVPLWIYLSYSLRILLTPGTLFFDAVPTYKLRRVYVVQEVIARNQQYIHSVNCWPCSRAELAGYVAQVVAM